MAEETPNNTDTNQADTELDAIFNEIDKLNPKGSEKNTTDQKTGDFITKSEFDNSMSKMTAQLIEAMSGRSDKSFQSEAGDDDDGQNVNLSQLQKQVSELNLYIKKNSGNQNIQTEMDKVRIELRREQLMENVVQLFEEKNAEKAPHFKVDTLRMKFDMNRGMSERDALNHQLETHIQLVNKLAGKDTGPGTRIANADPSNRTVPEDLKGFDPELYKKPKDFRALSNTDKDEYWRKLEKWNNLR